MTSPYLGKRSLPSHCSMPRRAAAPSEREFRGKLQYTRIEGRGRRQESGSRRERTGGRVENVLRRQQRVVIRPVGDVEALKDQAQLGALPEADILADPEVGGHEIGALEGGEADPWRPVARGIAIGILIL